MARKILGVVLGLVGAIIGGAVGVALVYWLRNQGFYAMMIPGAFVGLGAHVASPYPSNLRGAILGVAGLFVGVVTEWAVFWSGDPKFTVFLQEFPKQPTITFLMIGAGAIMAYWFGRQPSPWVSKMIGKPFQMNR